MEECIFCKMANGSIPSLKIYEDEYTTAFMDNAQDVDGHILAVPKAHIINILDCDEKTLSRVMLAVKIISDHLTENCGYDGINLLNASGESAGQSVAHFHIHIIPRTQGDGIDAWPRFTGSKQKTEEIYNKIKML